MAGQLDVGRVNPPHYAIIHNSVSPEDDVHRLWKDDDWRNYMSEIGRNRGYAGYAHSYHYWGGVETFAQAQHICVPNGDGSDINSDTWRVVDLVDDTKGDICWHAGNWPINCDSIGYENYGEYVDKDFPDNAVKALADHIRNGIDKWNGGVTIIKGHKEVSQLATGCPNKIMDKLGMLTDAINNPDKYSNLNKPKNSMDTYEIYDDDGAVFWGPNTNYDDFVKFWNIRKPMALAGRIGVSYFKNGVKIEQVTPPDFKGQIDALNKLITQQQGVIADAEKQAVVDTQTIKSERDAKDAYSRQVVQYQTVTIPDLNRQIAALKAQLNVPKPIPNDPNVPFWEMEAIQALKTIGGFLPYLIRKLFNRN